MKIAAQSLPPKASHLLKIISDSIDRGIHCPCVRYLAARLEISRQYAHRLLKILENLGFLRIIRRRISRSRNDTNIYQIIQVTEKQKGQFTEKQKEQIQEAPPAIHALKHENDSLKTQLRKLREHLAEQLRFYKGYIRRGEHMSRAWEWRKSRDGERERVKMLARVGRFIPPTGAAVQPRPKL